MFSCQHFQNDTENVSKIWMTKPNCEEKEKSYAKKIENHKL